MSIENQSNHSKSKQCLPKNKVSRVKVKMSTKNQSNQSKSKPKNDFTLQKLKS